MLFIFLLPEIKCLFCAACKMLSRSDPCPGTSPPQWPIFYPQNSHILDHNHPRQVPGGCINCPQTSFTMYWSVIWCIQQFPGKLVNLEPACHSGQCFTPKIAIYTHPIKVHRECINGPQSCVSMYCNVIWRKNGFQVDSQAWNQPAIVASVLPQKQPYFGPSLPWIGTWRGQKWA